MKNKRKFYAIVTIVAAVFAVAGFVAKLFDFGYGFGEAANSMGIALVIVGLLGMIFSVHMPVKTTLIVNAWASYAGLILYAFLFHSSRAHPVEATVLWTLEFIGIIVAMVLLIVYFYVKANKSITVPEFKTWKSVLIDLVTFAVCFIPWIFVYDFVMNIGNMILHGYID